MRRMRAAIANSGSKSGKNRSSIWEGLRPGPNALKNPHRLLFLAVSNTVGMWPQVVLWWVDGKFVAIDCIGPNHEHAMKIALYIHTFFLAPTGARGFRICPFDGEQFFQDKTNQEYCCPAHRDAHRVKRWRVARDASQNGRKSERKWHSKSAVTLGTRISLWTASGSGKSLDTSDWREAQRKERDLIRKPRKAS